MNATAYHTVNVLSQFPPLEFRRKQEEVKLYQKCIRGSIKFPDHNLTQGYFLWKEDHDIKQDEKFVRNGKVIYTVTGMH